MEFSFKDFLEQAYPHEMEMLQRLPGLDMWSQAHEDQKIHKRAVKKGTFDAFGSSHLVNDMELKERFKDFYRRVRKGEPVREAERAELQAGMRKDQDGHRDYLNRQHFHPDTGSDEWHRMWINIYDKWIEWLNTVGTNF